MRGSVLCVLLLRGLPLNGDEVHQIAVFQDVHDPDHPSLILLPVVPAEGGC